MPASSDVPECLRHRLREAREAAGLTKSELATTVGLTTATITRLESGERHPSLGGLVKLCDALDVTADHLLGRDAAVPADLPDSTRRLLAAVSPLPMADQDLVIGLARLIGEQRAAEVPVRIDPLKPAKPKGKARKKGKR